jgi:RNA polymerase sigma factor (sigma-70 family)
MYSGPSRASQEAGGRIGPARSCSEAGQGTESPPFLAGELAADFEAFYARHRDSVARTLALGFNDPELGFEAADEAMVRAYRNWSKVSRYDNPEGWVFRVGLNWGRSWMRRRLTATIKAPMLVDHGKSPTIEDLATDPDLAQAVAALKQDHRIVVVLRFERDYTVAQIAQILGVAEGTVKSRLSRALNLLAVELAATRPEEQR